MDGVLRRFILDRSTCPLLLMCVAASAKRQLLHVFHCLDSYRGGGRTRKGRIQDYTAVMRMIGRMRTIPTAGTKCICTTKPVNTASNSPLTQRNATRLANESYVAFFLLRRGLHTNFCSTQQWHTTIRRARLCTSVINKGPKCTHRLTTIAAAARRALLREISPVGFNRSIYVSELRR